MLNKQEEKKIKAFRDIIIDSLEKGIETTDEELDDIWERL